MKSLASTIVLGALYTYDNDNNDDDNAKVHLAYSGKSVKKFMTFPFHKMFFNYY